MRTGRFSGWRAVVAALCLAALASGGAHLAHATGFAQAHGPMAVSDAAAAAAHDGHGSGCADHAQNGSVKKTCAACVLHLSCLATAWPEAAALVPIAHAPDTGPAAVLLGRTIPPLLHPPDTRA